METCTVESHVVHKQCHVTASTGPALHKSRRVTAAGHRHATMPDFCVTNATSAQIEALFAQPSNHLLKELHLARLERRRVDAPAVSPEREAYFVRPLLVLDLDGTLLDTQKPGVRQGYPPSFLTQFSANEAARANSQPTRLRARRGCVLVSVNFSRD